MKAVKLLGKALALSTLFGLSATSQAYMLDDNYVGGDAHGHGDVIGSNSLFDTKGLDVTVSGSNVLVDIYTNFANTNAIGSFASSTFNGLGIGSGDLFLSNSYTPYGSSSNGYLTDNASNGNFWTYGLSINDRYSETGGSASLYALNGPDNDASALLSEDFLSRNTFRNGQEVAIDTQSPFATVINT